MQNKYFIVVLFFFTPVLVFSQVKVEKELKIQRSRVPVKALDWLEDAIDQKKQLKWYYETDGDHQSFEAKFKRKGRSYSVEFDTDGVVEDIEIIEHWRKLPLLVRNNISDYLQAEFSKSRIDKVEFQYSGTEEALKNWENYSGVDQIVIKYEVEFYGKEANNKKFWEGLFDKDGNILNRREIIITPSNNLFF
jgi:hypothetical protein